MASRKMTSELWASVEHFDASEFNRPDMMEWDLLRKLEIARLRAGIPLVVNFNAFRTPSHNNAVDGADDSAHLRGYAVDIRCRTSRNRYRVLEAVLYAGFHRIGIRYPNHIHVDADPSLSPMVAW